MSMRLLKKGFRVRATFSGKEAIEAAKEEQFDVAVVDLMMSGMDGVETQKQLHMVQPFLQCIVLTGHGSIDSAFKSGQEDAFLYLLKPIDYDKLVNGIEDAYKKKVHIQTEKFQEKVEEIYRSGMGARGIKKAINELQKTHGI